MAEIAERRCILVLGAGVSAGSKSLTTPPRRPATWKQFLTNSLKFVRVKTDADEAERLIAKDQLLDAAQIIVDGMDDADFSKFIRDELATPRFQPSKIHEIILDIDPKIVVTFNYDEIYDMYCKQGKAQEGYNICRYYDSHAINDIRSTIRSILKAHGCVSDPSKVVLSRSQYFNARRNYPSFYAILDALFLTNTLLFIGTSLGDPDIQLVLENVNISAPSSHPHYALVEEGRHSSIKAAMRKTYNLELIEYPAGQHDVAEAALEELKNSVLGYRFTHP
ncbi:SIR2 family NAD-dependent protein deacylase [Archangium gephyra]|uniref:SIR2 family NAD-dependent protein deacylase n=1 Tax=Archangium gephyra TaxID=48 RepID=UPI0014711E88|nr:SIR2 family protein [Archangium gephyra]